LKVAASEHFPFSIFAMLSGVDVSISEGTEYIPLVLDFGEYGPTMSFDWQSNEVMDDFQAVTKPFSTIVIWLYFIGFLSSLRPKAGID